MGSNWGGLQACLNAPEPTPGNENGVDDSQVDSPEESTTTHMTAARIPQNPHMATNYGGMPGVGMDPSQVLAYQNYAQQRGAQYAMPAQGGMAPHNAHQA